MRGLGKQRVTKVKEALMQADRLIRDERLRSDLQSAVGHAMAAIHRFGKRPGLSGVGDQLMSDYKLRTNLRAFLDDLDNAGARVRRKSTHRVRNTLFVLGVIGGTLTAVAPRARRWAANGLSRSHGGTIGVAKVEQTIEVDVPASTAYNQWTQFEEFPRFMEGVEEVRQLDDTLLHWAANVSGKRQEWDAKIVEQTPDRRVAWESVSGKETNGVVSFEPAGTDRTRVHVTMSYRPEGLEWVGSAIGLDDRRVRGDLNRFKKLIEARGIDS
jgi:uncharacterized membrane protein